MANDTPARPGPEHERLAALVGTWKTEGRVKAGPWGSAAPIAAEDTYEWLDGGFFLIHRFDALVGTQDVKGIEVIGCDMGAGGYRGFSFDNQGAVDSFEASLVDGVWKTWGPLQRFTGRFSADGRTLSGEWERSEDGMSWSPWMDVTLTRKREVRSVLTRRRPVTAGASITQATSAGAVGAAALGALAIGATAIGALAIRRLAVGSLALKHGRIGTLAIDDVDVGRLRVHRLVTDGERY
jgi:hypothetical protein